MPIHIYIDQRERKNFGHFEDILNKPPTFNGRDDVTYEIKTITVGDFLITHKQDEREDILAVIERKTLKDYASTIKDTKRYQNKNKLIKLREEVGCKVFYLVEGHMNPKYDTQYCGIEYSKILANIHDMEIQHDFHVVRQSNGENTAKWLKFIAEHYSGYVKKPEFRGSSEHPISITDRLKKCQLSPEQKDTECVIYCWSKLRGIGDKTASMLSRAFTLRELINNEITEQAVLDAKKEFDFRIGKNAITSLTTLLDEETCAKILTEFPGISKTSAAKLLAVKTLSEIIDATNADSVSSIFVGKNKFGTKKLENIYRLVSLKVKHSVSC